MDPISCERLRETLPEFVARVRAETNVPGVTVAVSIRGSRVNVEAGTRVVGEAFPLAIDDGFHLGCITHLLLAIAALELQRTGRLRRRAPRRVRAGARGLRAR